jgi:hypothetical protein
MGVVIVSRMRRVKATPSSPGIMTSTTIRSKARLSSSREACAASRASVTR